MAGGGHLRLLHTSYFTRYWFGFVASAQLLNFCAEQQYGVNRQRNPNIHWNWWSDVMDLKRAGNIPWDYPGYMLAKYRNDQEQTYVEKYGWEELDIAPKEAHVEAE